MSPERFKAVLDKMVIFAIRVQEQAGIDAIGDGEWRRTQYIGEFLKRIGGFERCRRYEHQGEVHLHCCHSVYKRRSDVTGNYKPILPRLAKAKVDRINLEFAYTGTGDISDLELLPAHLGVGMGVVDVRSAQPQTVEQIEAIAAAGAGVINPGRIALNPDCGFAPDAGEPPTIDEAFEKLCRLSTAAARLRQRFKPAGAHGPR